MNLQGVHLHTVLSGNHDSNLNRYHWVEERIEVAQGQHNSSCACKRWINKEVDTNGVANFTSYFLIDNTFILFEVQKVQWT